MMKLWKSIDKLNLKEESKFRLFRIISEGVSAVLGLLVWLIIRNRIFGTWDWAVCFMGYPIIFSLFVSAVYSCSHSFHNGKPESL